MISNRRWEGTEVTEDQHREESLILRQWVRGDFKKEAVQKYKYFRKYTSGKAAREDPWQKNTRWI